VGTKSNYGDYFDVSISFNLFSILRYTRRTDTKKKSLPILLALVLLASLTTPVFAGKWVTAQQAPFYLVPSGSSNFVSTTLAGGEVHIVDPMGNVSLIIQGNVKGLAPNTNYAAWVRDLDNYSGSTINSAPSLGYFKLVTFMTDEYGDGSFHINLRAEDLPDGTYYIQVAINLAGADPTTYIGTTVVATQWPGLAVTVKSQ